VEQTNQRISFSLLLPSAKRSALATRGWQPGAVCARRNTREPVRAEGRQIGEGYMTRKYTGEDDGRGTPNFQWDCGRTRELKKNHLPRLPVRAVIELSGSYLSL
jgi:hypothetical protein